MELQGATAIVTGGARGMGAAHVRGLVARGADVLITDVLDDDGAALVSSLDGPGRAEYARLDVRDEQQWAAVVARAEERFGPVGVLVNNAGIVTWGSIEEQPLADWQRVIDINLTGVWLGMKSVVPSMRRAGGGAIVNISSTAGLQGYPGISPYVASKWGVRGITKAAAIELGQYGIRVNSIHPGPIDTPMTANRGDEMAAGHPIPRKGTVDEVTAMLLFVIAEATYSTGREFVIDGGATAGQPRRT